MFDEEKNALHLMQTIFAENEFRGELHIVHNVSYGCNGFDSWIYISRWQNSELIPVFESSAQSKNKRQFFPNAETILQQYTRVCRFVFDSMQNREVSHELRVSDASERDSCDLPGVALPAARTANDQQRELGAARGRGVRFRDLRPARKGSALVMGQAQRVGRNPLSSGIFAAKRH
jgi:hypothetical protein